MEFIKEYLEEVVEIANKINLEQIERAVKILIDIRERSGRVFVLGVGGSSATASHAVNDLRKICGIESYAPTDNVAELTAITNDEGWENSFCDWLYESNLREDDCLLIFSVGGGNREKHISENLIKAIHSANASGARVISIVGRDGGYIQEYSHSSILIPVVNPERITPHTEGFASIVLHLLVSHPLLQAYKTKWESQK